MQDYGLFLHLHLHLHKLILLHLYVTFYTREPVKADFSLPNAQSFSWNFDRWEYILPLKTLKHKTNIVNSSNPLLFCGDV